MDTIDRELLESVSGGAARPRAHPHASPPPTSAIKRIGGKVIGYGGAAMNVAGNLLFAIELGQMAYGGYQWLTGKGDSSEAPASGKTAPSVSSQPPLE